MGLISSKKKKQSDSLMTSITDDNLDIDYLTIHDFYKAQRDHAKIQSEVQTMKPEYVEISNIILSYESQRLPVDTYESSLQRFNDTRKIYDKINEPYPDIGYITLLESQIQLSREKNDELNIKILKLKKLLEPHIKYQELEDKLYTQLRKLRRLLADECRRYPDRYENPNCIYSDALFSSRISPDNKILVKPDIGFELYTLSEKIFD